MIRQFQVVQRDRTLEVRLIRGPDFEAVAEELILEALEKEFESYFEVIFRYVDVIEREASGKVRLVKREAPID